MDKAEKEHEAARDEKWVVPAIGVVAAVDEVVVAVVDVAVDGAVAVDEDAVAVGDAVAEEAKTSLANENPVILYHEM